LIVTLTTVLAKHAMADFDFNGEEARRNIGVRRQRLAEIFSRLANANPHSVASQFDVACRRQRKALEKVCGWLAERL